ncbi:MAG: hypothetical protein ACR2FX_00290 [Chthoniobacterales bacterium]
MSAKNRLLLALSILLLLLALGSLLSPFVLTHTVALWLRYEAQRSGLTITTSEIRAPFLHPVEILGLHVLRPGVGGAHFEMSAPHVEAGFRLASLFDRSERSRPLRSLRIEHARVVLRGRALASAGNVDWATLGSLLPEEFEISADDILCAQSLARVELHDTRISGTTRGSGALTIGSIELGGPYLQKTFADVHGVTRWQDGRLTIGAIRLLEGLSIDSLALDLRRLRATRIAAEGSVTVFNGNLRANLATERTGSTRMWEAAGSASGVSLSQLAPALGWTEPVNGSLRASKFSFRGDPRDLLHATASLWTELTGFNWRERNADVIMIGANYYERTVQLQELYIKQRGNELTLSGETSLSANWLNPDFRGDVSGSIGDLGEFAELLGAETDAFAGKVAIRGRVHAHERKVDGELALTGDALKIFRTPVDSLTARLTLDSPRMQLTQFELRRGEDFLRGTGQVDFSRRRTFELSGDSWCHDLNQYDARVPLLGPLTGTLFTQLDASGDDTNCTLTLGVQTDDAKGSAHGVLRDNALALDSCSVTINDITAAFSGAINFQDRKNITATFSPATELHFPQELESSANCLRGIALQQGDSGVPLSQMAITARQLTLADPTGATRTLSLCDKDEAGTQPLPLSVPARSPSQ